MTRDLFFRVGVVCFAFLVPQLTRGQADVAQVKRANDVIEAWKPDQHLYVKGELGVARAQLTALEAWLDQHAPHWTVVLVETADGESFVSADGLSFQGMDAVEVALGRGLSNRTMFGNLEHPQTGEQDGAVFVLFLRERKLSYFSSDAQDRRNLGQSHWQGELDRPAIRAMRNGGRIVDAVRDTITQINERLAQAISREQAVEQRRQRDLLDARAALDHVRESIDEVITETSELKQKLPEASGAMLQAPTDAWTTRLETLINELSEDTLRENSRSRLELSAEISRYLNWFAGHKTFAETAERLEARISDATSLPNNVAEESVSKAQQLLESARVAHRQADPEFVTYVREIEQHLQTAAELGAAERARLAQLAARRRLIRNTVLATTAIIVLLVIGLLVYLNRRRAPVRDEAVKSLAEREKSVRHEMDRVSELLNRSREILGNRERVEKRGYEGATRALCDETFDTVDDLLVMSNEVDRVMDEARALIYPHDAIGKLVNKFSATPFERGMNRISGEPLTFHENQGIPKILCPPELDAPPETLSLTFEAVFDAFHQRTGNTADTLTLLEDCMVEVNDKLKLLQVKIDEATVVEKELSELAETDSFFPVPNFFDKLLPSAQTDHDQADDQAGVDPVQSVQVHIPSGLRKIEDGLQIAAAVRLARDEVFPKCDEFAPRLKALEYSTDWIETRSQRLGDLANELFELATREPVGDAADQLGADVRKVARDVEQCAELAEDLRNVHVPAIETLAANVVDARDEICRRLNLQPEKSLHEPSADPDVRIASAREQLSAVQAAIHQGEIGNAEQAAETLCDEVTMGHEIVSKTLEVLRTFQEEHRQRRNQRQEARANEPRIDQAVSDMVSRFANSALRLQAGNPTCPDEFATVQTRQSEVQTLLADADHFVDNCADVYQDGRLLEAATMLQAAEGQLEHANTLMDEILEHVDRLAAQQVQNRKRLQELRQHIDSLGARADDHHATRATIAAFQDLEAESQSIARNIEEALDQVDPFMNASHLERLRGDIEHVDKLLVADQNSFEEASRAVQGAANELATALRLVDQADRDSIPDSSMTTRLVQDIRDAQRTVDLVERRLKVPHEDWEAVDNEATRLTSELGRQAASLRGELDLGQRAIAALESASHDVFSATRWTGGFGVSVLGSPGSGELDRARRALHSGNYQAILELSRAAALAAQYAVERAQREAQRRQREARRREEEARRREAQRRRRMNRPTISFGSGSSVSSSRPKINVGSSMPKISAPRSRSNNSGFSRSGW